MAEEKKSISVPITPEMINLSELARRAGLSVSTLHRWLRWNTAKIVVANCIVNIVRK